MNTPRSAAGAIAPVLGVDLGTTNTVVAALDYDTPFVVPIDSAPLLKSTLDYDAGALVIGRRDGRIRSTKRHIGTDWTTTVDGHEWNARDAAAALLTHAVGSANTALGTDIRDVVITVPAHFDHAQRSDTAAAAADAGLNVLTILNEPTAAALAYGHDRVGPLATVAVVDFGGGTLDVSVLSMGAGVMRVLSTCGDNRLGGDDIDIVLAQALAAGGAEPLDLLASAEELKHALTYTPSATVHSHAGDGAPYALDRDTFDRLVADLLARAETVLTTSMEEAGIDSGVLDDVLLVGGSSVIPAFRDMVAATCGVEPRYAVDVQQAVALGAALYGGILVGSISGVSLVDVTSLTLGVGTDDGVMHPIIARNTALPATRAATFTTSVDDQTTATIPVFQGERPLVADNHHIADLTLDELPPAPAGSVTVTVVFTVNSDGTVTVDATGGDSRATATLTAWGRQQAEHIEAALDDAYTHHGVDGDIAERIYLRSQLRAGLLFARRNRVGDPAVLDSSERAVRDSELLSVTELGAHLDALNATVDSSQ